MILVCIQQRGAFDLDTKNNLFIESGKIGEGRRDTTNIPMERIFFVSNYFLTAMLIVSQKSICQCHFQFFVCKKKCCGLLSHRKIIKNQLSYYVDSVYKQKNFVCIFNILSVANQGLKFVRLHTYFIYTSYKNKNGEFNKLKMINQDVSRDDTTP